jgi:tetratricopeptide (TPR) repeat protein
MFDRVGTAALLIFFAAFLFFFHSVYAQALATNDSNRRLRPRAAPKETPPAAANRLPFEQSVIIYYGVPDKPKPSQPKPQPTTVLNGIRSTSVTNTPPTKSDIGGSSSKQANSGSNLIFDLQPVVISYRIAVPSLFVNANSSTSSTRWAFGENVPTKKAAAPPMTKQETEAAGTFPERTGQLNVSGTTVIKNNASSVGDSYRVGATDEKIEFRVVRSSVFTAKTKPDSELAPPVARGAAADGLMELNESGTVAEKKPETNTGKTEPAEADPVAVEKTNAAAKEAEPTTNGTAVAIQTDAIAATPFKASDAESENKKSANISETDSGSTTKPNSVVEMNNRAVRLTLESNYSEAEILLEKAIKEDPAVAKFHRNLSIVLEKLNRFDEALESARTAAKLDPTNPAILDQLCLLELAKGTPSAAVECYEKLDSVQSLGTNMQAYYGMALFRVGKVDESLATLERAAKSTPPVASVLNALGVVYFTKKRYDEAAAAFKNAVEADPDLSELRFNLAIAELACKNKPAALSQYNILKKDNSNLADQLFHALFSDKVVNVADLKTGRQ